LGKNANSLRGAKKSKPVARSILKPKGEHEPSFG